MSPARTTLPQAFKRAVVLSAALHVGLFVLIVVSPIAAAGIGAVASHAFRTIMLSRIETMTLREIF